jgi:hypothetical protein
MDVASASSALANGIIADQWATVASLQKRDMSPEDLAKLTEGLDAFIDLLFCQLQSLRVRLEDAGFIFALPDHALRATTDEDIAAIDAFIKKYGCLPLSVEAWYRRIASFNFGQDGSQMFDRSHGFYFMHRFHQFTMPPISTACTSRWDDMIGCEGDDEEHLTDDGKVFFPMEESGMDEDWKGFAMPDGSVDPVIDPETGTTFLLWAKFQTRWGGFGALAEAMKRSAADGVTTEFVERAFRSDDE